LLSRKRRKIHMDYWGNLRKTDLGVAFTAPIRNRSGPGA
jgi:hypothetical protein